MKKLISLFLSVLVLAVLYAFIDTNALLAALKGTSSGPLFLSLILLIALIGVSALRLRILARAAGLEVALPTATAATLAANALNIFLPAKMGDIAKATMLRDSANSALPSLNISIYEKATDVFALFAWGTLALIGLDQARHGFSTLIVVIITVGLGILLFSTAPVRGFLGMTRMVGVPPAATERYFHMWTAMIERLWRQPAAMVLVLALSAAIWAGHFVQIALMTWALGVNGPWLALGAALPLIILAGFVPFTFAGIGTRDAMIILLAGPLIGPEKAAALGILFWLRYLVPGLMGLPLIPHYLRSLDAGRRETNLPAKKA